MTKLSENGIALYQVKVEQIDGLLNSPHFMLELRVLKGVPLSVVFCVIRLVVHFRVQRLLIPFHWFPDALVLLKLHLVFDFLVELALIKIFLAVLLYFFICEIVLFEQRDLLRGQSHDLSEVLLCSEQLYWILGALFYYLHFFIHFKFSNSSSRCRRSRTFFCYCSGVLFSLSCSLFELILFPG